MSKMLLENLNPVFGFFYDVYRRFQKLSNKLNLPTVFRAGPNIGRDLQPRGPSDQLKKEDAKAPPPRRVVMR